MVSEVPYINPLYFFEKIYLLLVAMQKYLFATAIFFEERVFVLVLNIVSLLIFLLFIFVKYKATSVTKREDRQFLAQFEATKNPETEKLEEWQDVLDHIESDNESQWKLALIDADKVLENALRTAGYEGETLGDRLKAAEFAGGFGSLQDAWEAHKVRNRIAHESGFVLTKRETRRAVELYKQALVGLHYL